MLRTDLQASIKYILRSTYVIKGCHEGSRSRWNTKEEKSLHLPGRETEARLQGMFSKQNVKIRQKDMTGENMNRAQA